MVDALPKKLDGRLGTVPVGSQGVGHCAGGKVDEEEDAIDGRCVEEESVHFSFCTRFKSSTNTMHFTPKEGPYTPFRRL